MKLTQNQIESELSDIVPRGIRRDVARITQIYESTIYAMFNADDERKSAMFYFLQIQAALDEINGEVGEAHWLAMCRFRELSRPKTDSKLDASIETGNLAKEVSDVIIAHCNKKSLAIQLREICEVEAQLERTKKAVMDEMEKNEIKETYLKAV